MTSPSARVTVGMAAYNGALFMRHAIESLLAQTYTNFILLISDDGSTDATSAIAQEYVLRDSRVRYVRQREHLGAARNFDYLLHATDTEYFAWAADDDVWDPKFLERLVQTLDSCPEAVLASGRIDVIDRRGERLRRMNPKWVHLFNRATRIRSLAAVLGDRTGADLPSFLYGLVRRKALLATGGYERQGGPWDVYAGADLNLLFALLLQGPFRFVDETLFWKRIGIARGDYPNFENAWLRLKTFWKYESFRVQIELECLQHSSFSAREKLYLRCLIYLRRWNMYILRQVIPFMLNTLVERIRWRWDRASRYCSRLKEPYRGRLRKSLADWMSFHQQELAEKERVFWMGVPTFKCALDLWIYQEILFDTKPDVVVEIGSFYGGTTLFLANILEALGHGEVISVDPDRSKFQVKHPRIETVTGLSQDAAVLEEVRKRCAGKKVMVIQDGDHTETGVLRDLESYAPLVSSGCYFIVEDGTVDVFTPRDSLGRYFRGPIPAIDAFLKQHPEFREDEKRERYLITFNPQGYLLRQ